MLDEIQGVLPSCVVNVTNLDHSSEFEAHVQLLRSHGVRKVEWFIPTLASFST